MKKILTVKLRKITGDRNWANSFSKLHSVVKSYVKCRHCSESIVNRIIEALYLKSIAGPQELRTHTSIGNMISGQYRFRHFIHEFELEVKCSGEEDNENVRKVPGIKCQFVRDIHKDTHLMSVPMISTVQITPFLMRSPIVDFEERARRFVVIWINYCTK